MGVGVLETARTPGEARPLRLSQVGQRDSGATPPPAGVGNVHGTPS